MQIDTEQTFKQIKKQNGEAVAKVLRSEVLLDIPNLPHILEFAGNDPENIKNLFPVIREIYKTQNTPEYQTNKTPLELLSDAGYDAFVVKTEEQKNSIKKYYRPDEEICTLRDPHRHENFYMIHAVKRGADKIKPSKNPEREDEYGRSVISIQIAKPNGGFISIKNRYNHTVNNPDATFDNNPDEIIPGLSNSLKKFFNVDFDVSESVLPDNYRMVNDQFVYFNYEIENIYFGPDYYFSGTTITKLNTDYEIMLDYFILNTKTGELKNIIGPDNTTYKILQDLFKNKKISIRINPNNKHERMIYADNTHVLSVEKGTITELNLPDTKSIDDRFLAYNKKLKKFNAPKLEKVGNFFISHNTDLTELNLPSLKEVGSCFLYANYKLKIFNAPKLEHIGNNSLSINADLTELNLPSLTEVGSDFLHWNNQKLKTFNAPKLEKVGDLFLSHNTDLTELKLPSLQETGRGFLSKNTKLEIFYAPKLQQCPPLNNKRKLTELVVADINIKEDKRLLMRIAKNKMKKKMKDDINNLINTLKTTKIKN